MSSRAWRKRAAMLSSAQGQEHSWVVARDHVHANVYKVARFGGIVRVRRHHEQARGVEAADLARVDGPEARMGVCRFVLATGGNHAMQVRTRSEQNAARNGWRGPMNFVDQVKVFGADDQRHVIGRPAASTPRACS